MSEPVPVLLVAYYYPPLGGVGSRRALAFARHLPEFGFEPVVVTPKRGAYGPLWASSRCSRKCR